MWLSSLEWRAEANGTDGVEAGARRFAGFPAPGWRCLTCRRLVAYAALYRPSLELDCLRRADEGDRALQANCRWISMDDARSMAHYAAVSRQYEPGTTEVSCGNPSRGEIARGS